MSQPRLHRSGDKRITYRISNVARVHYGVFQKRKCTPWAKKLSFSSAKNRLLHSKRRAHNNHSYAYDSDTQRMYNGMLQTRKCTPWRKEESFVSNNNHGPSIPSHARKITSLIQGGKRSRTKKNLHLRLKR